jgi:transcriptional regulator with XRE-family HTH domain
MRSHERSVQHLPNRRRKRPTLRKQNNLSQLELAEKADLSLTFINNIENGKKWVSPETLSILCAVLNAYPFEFFVTTTCRTTRPGAAHGRPTRTFLTNYPIWSRAFDSA